MPPTDFVIMRKILVENDEFGLRSVANICRTAREEEFDQARVPIPPAKSPRSNFYVAQQGNFQFVVPGISAQGNLADLAARIDATLAVA
jgi:hypothetical protein